MKRSLGRCVSWSLLTLALVMLAPSLTYPQQESARLAGSVRSSLNGRPMAGVMIAVQGTKVFDVSNAVGLFTLAGLPSGHRTLHVLFGDSVSYEQDILLTSGQTLTLAVLLAVDTLELSPIVVEAKSSRAAQSLVGFYDRKDGRFGRFYTREELHLRQRETLRTLLSEAGVWIRCGRGSCLPLDLSGPHACVLSVYLDGGRWPSDQMEGVLTDDLAGVEVYRRAVEVPVEFQYGYGHSCGAVLMWRRH